MDMKQKEQRPARVQSLHTILKSKYARNGGGKAGDAPYPPERSLASRNMTESSRLKNFMVRPACISTAPESTTAGLFNWYTAAGGESR